MKKRDKTDKICKSCKAEDRESEKIRRLEKENRRLRSENKTLKNAWEATETYLIAISRDKTINDIFQEIEEKTDRKVKEKCPKCGCEEMTRINLGNIKIICCSGCDYRNRVNEKGPAQT